MLQVKVKLKARIRSKEGLGAGYFILDLVAPPIAAQAKPGQFVMITVSESLDPLLPRPFSILEVGQETVSILIKEVGRGTRILHELISGMSVGIIGPLGNSFPDVSRAALVAGGYGVAPFFFLSRRLREGQVMDFFYGGKSKQDVLFFDHFERLLGRAFCHVSTEDGSYGKRGLVTDLLQPALERPDHGYEAIFTCGPTPMMRAVHELAHASATPCYVSMENMMGCGYGVCLGCVVPTSEGMVRTCKDGPILRSDLIEWESL